MFIWLHILIRMYIHIIYVYTINRWDFMYLYVCIYISYTYTLHIFMRIIHVCVIHVYTCTILYIQSTYILHIYIYIGVFLAYKYKCINHAHIHRGIGVGSCLSFEEIVIGVFRVYTCPHI